MRREASILAVLVAAAATIAWLARDAGDVASPQSIAPRRNPPSAGPERLDAPSRDAAPSAADDPEETPAPAAQVPVESAGAPPTEALPEHGIEVVVLVDDEPAREGWVHFVKTATVPVDAWSDAKDARHLPLGSEGRVLATDLGSGEWIIGADIPDSTPHWRRSRYDTSAPQRIVIELGTARLYGTVYDALGAPIANARVTMSGVRSRVNVSDWTDSRGDYSLESLPAELCWLTIDSERAVRDEMSRIQLEEGEARRRDFGRAGGLPAWSGTVRNADGEPSPNYPGPGRSGKVHLKRVSDGAYSAHRFQIDGSFSIALEPGEYTVAVNAASRTFRWKREEPVVVPETGLQLDVVIGGARVTGSVTDGAGSPVENVQVHLVRVGAGAEYSVEPDSDGRYAIDGVEPGAYTLRTWPRKNRASGQVTVRADDAAIERDLVLVE